MSSRPLVYIAGPYTKPDPCENTHAAVKVADSLLDVCAPVVPHLAHFWHTMSPKPYDVWLDLALAYLERCDALLRIGGDSPGAVVEVAKALEWGIPVFHSMGGLRVWLASEPAPMREISFRDRVAVAEVASEMTDDSGAVNETGEVLVDAVRCCGEFPECSHVLSFLEALDV